MQSRAARSLYADRGHVAALATPIRDPEGVENSPAAADRPHHNSTPRSLAQLRCLVCPRTSLLEACPKLAARGPQLVANS